MNSGILKLNPMKLTFPGSKITRYRQFHMQHLSVNGALKKSKEKKKNNAPNFWTQVGGSVAKLEMVPRPQPPLEGGVVDIYRFCRRFEVCSLGW